MTAALRIVLFSLVVIACVSEAAFAGNSFSTTASCSIPVVPGLNAPPEESPLITSADDQLLRDDAETERTTLYAR